MQHYLHTCFHVFRGNNLLVLWCGSISDDTKGPDLQWLLFAISPPPHTQQISRAKDFFFFFFCFLGSYLWHNQNSCVRGQIRAIAAGLHHSYSNLGSESCLWPMPQFTAPPDPSPTEQGQWSNLSLHGYQLGLFPLSHNGNYWKRILKLFPRFFKKKLFGIP